MFGCSGCGNITDIFGPSDDFTILCEFEVNNKVSQLYKYVHPLPFRFFSHISHYRGLGRIPCAIQQLLVSYLFYMCAVLCLVAQSCLTLCDAVNCSPRGSSVHGDSPGKKTGVGCHDLLQGIFQPRDQAQVLLIAGRFFTIWATREAQEYWSG